MPDAGRCDQRHIFFASQEMEQYLHTITIWLATLAELFAAIIIGIAAVRAFVNYFFMLLRRKHDAHHNNIRLQLGRSLALGLEFLLGADILKTAVSPNWHDLGILAAIAFLRTALNYFLDRELKNHEEQKEARSSGPPPAQEITSRRDGGKI